MYFCSRITKNYMMKKYLLLALATMTLNQTVCAKDVFVNTPKTTLMLSVNDGETPRIQ